jgi:hypothetical protein
MIAGGRNVVLCGGCALAFWMRINGSMALADGYPNSNALVGTRSTSDQSKWVFGTTIGCIGTNTADYSIKIWTNNSDAVFYGTDLIGGPSPFGQDGKTLDTENWYFYLLWGSGSSSTSKMQMVIADLQGNYRFTDYKQVTKWQSYPNAGYQQSFEIGGWDRNIDSRDDRVNVDICQLRAYMQTEVDGWENPLNTTFFSEGQYLKQYSKAGDDAYLRNVGGGDGAWRLSGAWTLNGESGLLCDDTVNSHASVDLELGDDGELVESGGPALEAA